MGATCEEDNGVAGTNITNPAPLTVKEAMAHTVADVASPSVLIPVPTTSVLTLEQAIMRDLGAATTEEAALPVHVELPQVPAPEVPRSMTMPGILRVPMPRMFGAPARTINDFPVVFTNFTPTWAGERLPASNLLTEMPDVSSVPVPSPIWWLGKIEQFFEKLENSGVTEKWRSAIWLTIESWKVNLAKLILEIWNDDDWNVRQQGHEIAKPMMRNSEFRRIIKAAADIEPDPSTAEVQMRAQIMMKWWLDVLQAAKNVRDWKMQLEGFSADQERAINETSPNLGRAKDSEAKAAKYADKLKKLLSEKGKDLEEVFSGDELDPFKEEPHELVGLAPER
jgi:hypothetical protein